MTLSVAAAEEETHPMPLRTGAIPGEEGRPPAAQVRVGLPTVTVAGHGQGTTSTAAVLRGSTHVMCEGEEATRQQEQTHRAQKRSPRAGRAGGRGRCGCPVPAELLNVFT